MGFAVQGATRKMGCSVEGCKAAVVVEGPGEPKAQQVSLLLHGVTFTASQLCPEHAKLAEDIAVVVTMTSPNPSQPNPQSEPMYDDGAEPKE